MRMAQRVTPEMVTMLSRAGRWAWHCAWGGRSRAWLPELSPAPGPSQGRSAGSPRHVAKGVLQPGRAGDSGTRVGRTTEGPHPAQRDPAAPWPEPTGVVRGGGRVRPAAEKPAGRSVGRARGAAQGGGDRSAQVAGVGAEPRVGADPHSPPCTAPGGGRASPCLAALGAVPAAPHAMVGGHSHCPTPHGLRWMSPLAHGPRLRGDVPSVTWLHGDVPAAPCPMTWGERLQCPVSHGLVGTSPLLHVPRLVGDVAGPPQPHPGHR